MSGGARRRRGHRREWRRQEWIGGAGDADTPSTAAQATDAVGAAERVPDMLSGGAGNDVYVVDDAGDEVTEEPASRQVWIAYNPRSLSGLARVGTVETLTLAGSGGDRGHGRCLQQRTDPRQHRRGAA